MRLLGGTFSPTTHEEDVLALMKRANVVIFGRRAVYLRKACPEPSKAKVIHYPELDDRNLLTSDMTERMRAYRKGKKVTPPEDDVEWSLAFTKRCMYELPVTGFKYEVVHGVGKPTVREVKPTLETLDVGPDAAAPQYVPGQPASSGTNGNAAPVDPMDIDDEDAQAHHDIRNDNVASEIPVAQRKRKSFACLNLSQPAVVIDLDEFEDVHDEFEPAVKEVKQEPEVEHDNAQEAGDGEVSLHAAHGVDDVQQDRDHEGMAIVPASQSHLAYELGRLMSQAPTFHQDEENDDDDVIVDEDAQTSD